MTAAPSPSSPAPKSISIAEIDASCRLPLFLMFVSAAVWLVIGSAFALIATLTFHKPSLFADYAWLSYGRAWPAYLNCVLFGFCLQTGLGVALWMIARLGRTRLPRPWIVAIGAKLWNLGVTIGVIGILAGDATGFHYLEMPRYAALILFLGYLLIGLWILLTFHQRRQRSLFVSQWFLLAALFWFPWIYSTANLLLITFPVRGVAQAVIAWWYSANLQIVWLASVGLAAFFYFVPKFTGRALYSHYLALFAFWTLLLFGGWTGIPNTAPVPAWMPALSTVTTVLMLIPLLAVALNIYRTVESIRPGGPRNPELNFMMVGVAAFIIVGLMNIFTALTGLGAFTWFIPATTQLNVYGFFTFTLFGAIYYIVPQIIGIELRSQKMVRAHFWLALTGMVLLVLPLAAGGILQGIKLQNPSVPFPEIMKFTLHLLRVSTIGELLIMAGNVLFLGNLGGLVVSLYRARATAAYSAVTAEIQPAKLTP